MNKNLARFIWCLGTAVAADLGAAQTVDFEPARANARRAEAFAGPEVELRLAQAGGQPAEAVFLADSHQENFVVEALGGPPRPRTLVIRTGDADPKSSATLEEDLSIMSRILAKSVRDIAGNDDALTAMGMKIRSLAWPNSGTAQNLYLDGYGAVFILNVRFPLLPPAEKTDAEESKASKDSTWEETKRELYGPKEELGVFRLLAKDKVQTEFSASLVAKLKDALLQALKNATHIRALKSDEFVTLTVIGTDSGAAGTVRVITTDSNTDQKSRATRSSRIAVAAAPKSGMGETVMTLRARKSDVDGFASGKLTLEQFKDRVAVSTY